MPRRKKAAAVPQVLCTCIEPKRLALTAGCFLALMHLGWAILVASGFAQAFYNWILQLHMLSIPITVLAFDPVMTIELLIVTFIGGYVGGWIFAYIWNWVAMKKYCKC